MVTVTTMRAVVVIFAPVGTPADALSHVLDVTSARMCQYAGGREIERLHVP